MLRIINVKRSLTKKGNFFFVKIIIVFRLSVIWISAIRWLAQIDILCRVNIFYLTCLRFNSFCGNMKKIKRHCEVYNTLSVGRIVCDFCTHTSCILWILLCHLTWWVTLKKSEIKKKFGNHYHTYIRKNNFSH